jgi:hypothetical protein
VKSAAVSEGEIAVASTEQLHSAPLSGKGLLALWNARPGIEKRKKVGDRDALIDQWAAIEASPEPEPQADAKRPPKQEKVIEMLRRPEGATVDEVVRATAWQRHTVRGVFLVRQFEEILNIWPQFASKVASASMEELRRERPRPRAADDFSTIRARMEELRQIIPSQCAAGKSHARPRGGACIPGARLRTVPLIAAVAPRRQPRSVTCPVADRGGTSWIIRR